MTTSLGLLLSDDLIFTSRVTGTARALGLMVTPARSADTLLELARRHAPTCVLIDLANPGLSVPAFLAQLAEACPARPRVVAYGSHVDAAGLRAARDAGCDLVLPRSKFVEDLPVELTRWLTDEVSGEEFSRRDDGNDASPPADQGKSPL